MNQDNRPPEAPDPAKTAPQAIGKITPAQQGAPETASGTPAPKAGGVAKPQFGEAEREFLPAALEILETPPNPAGRMFALGVAAFFCIAVLWAYIGQVDIVAVAEGRVVPVGGVKQVQPLEIGIVRAIHVTDGQHVDAGDVLIELDPTESEVDKDQLLRERIDAGVEVARLIAFIEGLQGGDPVFEPEEAAIDPDLVAMQGHRLLSDLLAFDAEIAALDAEIARSVADQAAIQSEVEKIIAMLPLMEEREASLHGLMVAGHTPKPVWQEAKTQLIESQHNLTIQRHRLEESENGTVATWRQRERIQADRLRDAYGELSEARKSFEQADLALRKALKREAQHRLDAPVAGTVQQLEVHTIGGVVQPAEVLMVIVPDDVPLEARVQVLNRDKGFIVDGQEAEVKLEAFNFTKYGTIDGSVVSLSSDAVEDEQLGLVYDTRIALAADSIRADGRDVPLTPGMAVSVEIKTGSRRIMEFLLSPLRRYQDEAIRER